MTEDFKIFLEDFVDLLKKNWCVECVDMGKRGMVAPLSWGGVCNFSGLATPIEPSLPGGLTYD